MVNVVIIFGVFSGVGLAAYLLIIGKISSVHFCFLFLISILVALAFYVSDRLKELDIKNARLILTEVREAKEDIYAKAETVKKLGEALADFTAFNVTQVGRFASKDLKEKMIESRDKIVKVLHDIGSDETKVEQISSQINQVVLRDLKEEVYSRIQEITHKVLTSGKQIDRNTVHKTAENLLFDKYDREKLVSFLKEQGVYESDLEQLLDKVDNFIR